MAISYKLVTSDSADGLSTAVSALLALAWELSGSAFVGHSMPVPAPAEGSHPVIMLFAQAMIKKA